VTVVKESNNLRVTWTTVGGKSYRVQTNAVGASDGSTTHFSDLSPLFSIPGVGESTANYLHVSGATGVPGRDYRVRLGP